MGLLIAAAPAAAQAAAPLAETLPPGAIRFDRALLGGRVAAGGEATTYRVEYGQTTAYGSEVPLAPGDAGGGTTPVLRTHVVPGLQSDTTYHYRLVATNAAGTSEGADRTFTTPAASTAGSERAYEQVSPPDKNSWPVYFGIRGWNAKFPGGVSRDGERVVFGSFGSFAGATSGAYTTYAATRTDSGWTSEPVGPPVRAAQGTMPTMFTNDLELTTLDLDAALIVTRDVVDPAVDTLDDSLDIYVRARDRGEYELASRANNGERPNDEGIVALAISDGGHAALFKTHSELVPGTAVPGVRQLYLRRRGETFHIPMPDGQPTLTEPALPRGPTNELSLLSDDGSRVTFGVGGQIYQWVLGEGTRRVSEPETAVTPAAVTLVRSSRDGRRILMRVNRGASNQLTADGSVNGGFYEYVDDGAGGADLQYRGGELVHTSTITFNGEMIASPDLNVIYYQVVYAQDGFPYIELRRLEGSAFSTVARSHLTTPPILQLSGPGSLWEMSITPDGGGLLFYSRARITAYDNAGLLMAYLYSEERGLQCLSCRPDGSVPVGAVAVNEARTSLVSDDSSRALFTTSEALTPSDVNERYDVYEWHDGQTSLLSTGRSPDDSYVVGMSGNGRDAVFATNESLVWQDIDGGDMDFYDARIGGGFGSAPRPPAPCLGDLCQGMSPVAPPARRAGSESFRGAGNVSRTSVRVARVRAARGASTRLRVRVSGVGRVSVSGGLVRGTSRTVSEAGRVELRVALTRRARRALRRRGTVVVRVRVSFRASDGEFSARSLSVTFRRPKGGR